MWKLQLTLALSFTNALFASSNPLFIDFSKHQNFLCQPKSAEVKALGLLDFWIEGIHSANIHYNLFKAEPGKFREEELKQQAVYRAIERDHAGFSFGLCDSEKNAVRFWTLSTPAPILIDHQTSKESLEKAAKASCRQLKQKITDLDAKKNGSKKNASLLAIYCLPKVESLGPWLWAIVPQNDPKLILEAMSQKMPKPAPLSSDNLLDWINQRREEVNLRKLRLSSTAMTEALTAIDHKQGVSHQRKTLAEIRQTIERRGFHFLGENRLQASDLAEAASMLWLSPSHRELILDVNASHVSILTGTTTVIFALKQREKNHGWLITPPKLLQIPRPSDAENDP